MNLERWAFKHSSPQPFLTLVLVFIELSRNILCQDRSCVNYAIPQHRGDRSRHRIMGWPKLEGTSEVSWSSPLRFSGCPRSRHHPGWIGMVFGWSMSHTYADAAQSSGEAWESPQGLPPTGCIFWGSQQLLYTMLCSGQLPSELPTYFKMCILWNGKKPGWNCQFCTAHIHPLNGRNIFALHSSKLLFTLTPQYNILHYKFPPQTLLVCLEEKLP